MKNALFVCLSLSALLMVVFYPTFYTSTDERDYIQNAYNLTNGELVQYAPQCFEGSYCGYFNGEGYVSKYNLGLSIMYYPFVQIHWRLSFVVVGGLFLIGIYFFHKLLKEKNLDSKFLYLYTFLPLFVYYSHKFQTEVPSASLATILIYLYTKLKTELKVKHLIFFGFVAGVLVLIRYTNAIIPLILLLGLLTENLKKSKKVFFQGYKKFFAVLLGCLPFLTLFFYINFNLYGDYLSSGYSLSGEEFLFDFELLPKQLGYYFLYLNLIYPAMLVLIFVKKSSYKFVTLSILILYLAIYAPFPGYHFESGILNLIFGLRFFVPIFPLLLITYFEIIQKSYNKFTAYKYIWICIIMSLMTNSVVMNYVYMQRQNDLKEKSDLFYMSTKNNSVEPVEDIQDRILINDAFEKGKRYIYLESKTN